MILIESEIIGALEFRYDVLSQSVTVTGSLAFILMSFCSVAKNWQSGAMKDGLTDGHVYHAAEYGAPATR